MIQPHKNSSFALIPILILVVLFAVNSHARDWSFKKDTKIDLLYTPGYDNNILELSERDIDRLVDNTLPGITVPNTYDDLTQDFGIKFSFTSPKILGRKTRLYYTLKYSSFTNNPFNNRTNHSLFLIQDITKKVDFIGGYFLIPNRYLRDYYDKDTGGYHPSEFAYHQYNAGLRVNLLKKLRVDLRYEGYQVYYNQYFSEYDSEAHGFRGDLRLKLPKRLTVKSTFKFRVADNIGYDESSEIVAANPDLDAEYGDGSYEEIWFEYGLGWVSNPFLGKVWDISIAHRMRCRFYTSQLNIVEDPFHAGREHSHQRIMFNLDTQLLEKLSIGALVEYEFRRTDSEDDRVPIAKDFDTYRAGMKLVYTLW